MRYPVVVFALMIIGATSFPAYGAELDELKATVGQLQQRIEQLESRPKTEASQPGQAPTAQTGQTVANPVIAGSFPGSFLAPGTDTSLKVYGNVRVDATYDIKGRSNDILNNDWASAVFAQPFDTNVANRPRENQFFSTARASRLGVVTNTPTSLSGLEVKVEADFNAPNDYMGEFGSNGTMFRLRHAYGKLGNLLIGQTWSNFIDFRSYPETVDFNPPGNVTLIRQAQMRYTLPLGASSLSLSVENPESLTSTPPYQQLSNGSRNDFDSAPDFTLNWALHGENAHISARAATLEYRNDFHSKRGYALALSGSSKLGPGVLVASVQGGDGIGRYMFNSILQGATETGTELLLWNAVGWHLGYTLPWTSSVRSNFIFSRSEFSANEPADTFQRDGWLGKVDEFIPNKVVEQAFVNLLWAVAKNVETGIEYTWGNRVTFGDEKGTSQRISAMVQFNLP